MRVVHSQLLKYSITSFIVTIIQIATLTSKATGYNQKIIKNAITAMEAF